MAGKVEPREPSEVGRFGWRPVPLYIWKSGLAEFGLRHCIDSTQRRVAETRSWCRRVSVGGVNLEMFGRIIKALFSISPMSDEFRPAHGLAECLELANDECYTRSHGALSNRAYRFLASNGRIALVSGYVRERFGLSNFQYVGCGDNVIVVRYAEFQVLRIRGPAVETEVNTHRHLESPLICPVWREAEYEGARLNFVPYVPSLADAVSASRLSRNVAEEYMYAILRAGFENRPPLWFYDHKNNSYKFEQVGLLSDYTPIIVDLGSVILESDAPGHKFDLLAAHKMQASSRPTPPTPLWDGSWLDISGRPKIDRLPKPDGRVMS
jgi:hypothetical protein